MSGAGIWREPIRGGYPPPAALRLAGRERLEAWLRDGSLLPPLTHLTGARPARVGDGTADAEMPATDWLLNSAGLIGGGTLAILADIALGCAVETQLPPATPYTTAELSLTLLRPARSGATLSAHGQSIQAGRSVGLSEVFVIDPRGERLVAHGTSRLAILPRLEDLPESRQARSPAPASFDAPDPYRRPAPTDGVLAQSVWDELPGREILARQIAGELPPPPIHELCGLAVVEVGAETATMRLPATEWLNSPTGLLQGGAIAMLADAVLLSAALATADAGTALAGLDLKVNYLRPVPADGRDLIAAAEVVHSGRTLAISRARVENAEGKPVALATGTAMYLPGSRATLDREIELSGS
jgi:uncharacterized protein (TIGR00369 family)